MTPEVFNNLARTRLIDNKEDEEKIEEGLLNLVSLMYEEAYNNKEVYLKLPSASELLIALQDADILTKYANAPKNIIYDVIIRGMFKMEDDIKTFQGQIKNNNSLKNVIEGMINDKKDNNEEEISLNEIIMNSYFPAKKQELDEYMDEIIKALDEIEELRNIDPEDYEEDTDATIKLTNGEYLKSDSGYKPLSNFNDGTEYIRRGQDIFNSSNKEWAEVANIIIPTNQATLYFTKLLTDAYNKQIKAYENGYLLYENDETNIILIREDKDNNSKLTIFSDTKAISNKSISQIIKTIVEASTIIPATSNDYSVEINTLIAGNNKITDDKIDGFDNLYSYSFSTNNIEELKKESVRIINSIDSTPNVEEVKQINEQLESKIKVKKRK